MSANRKLGFQPLYRPTGTVDSARRLHLATYATTSDEEMRRQLPITR